MAEGGDFRRLKLARPAATAGPPQQQRAFRASSSPANTYRRRRHRATSTSSIAKTQRLAPTTPRTAGRVQNPRKSHVQTSARTKTTTTTTTTRHAPALLLFLLPLLGLLVLLLAGVGGLFLLPPLPGARFLRDSSNLHMFGVQVGRQTPRQEQEQKRETIIPTFFFFLSYYLLSFWAPGALVRARTIQRLAVVRDRCCCLAFDLEETPEAGGAGRPRNTRTEHATQTQTSTFWATAALSCGRTTTERL